MHNSIRDEKTKIPKHTTTTKHPFTYLWRDKKIYTRMKKKLKKNHMKILWKKQIKTNNACFVCFLEEKNQWS